jgi:hypothetical protein
METPIEQLLEYVDGLPSQSNSEEINCIKERIKQLLPKVYIPGGYSSDIIIESTDPEILNIYWLDETDE